MDDMPKLHEDLIKDFESALTDYSADDKALIMKAARFADEAHLEQLRKSGEPYIIHPFSVAKILVGFGMDASTVCAGLLHDVIEDTKYTYDDIKENFSPTIATIVEGVTKIEAIQVKSSSEAESETIRKMFFAMSKDPRVIIVKLADKLHNMKTLQYLLPKRAREIATECLDVFAPLADRLGMSGLKADLEDEALRILHPDIYILISEHMRQHYSERVEFLKKAEEKIRASLDENKITGYTINTRIKHPYSIYTKMRRRGKEISEIYDVLGCRIICKTVVECYAILGLVHLLWPPVEGRFKDYIAMPKANNYQSLHTTVLSDGGSVLEIQICTYEMAEIALFGVASHWSYKAASGSSSDAPSSKTKDEGYMRLMARLASWSDEIKGNDSFMDEIKSDMLRDSIVVFTPKGKSVELPIGSTALDFAYLIHTEIGNKTQSAKADGKIIPLSEPLKNTSVIEIITSQKAHPNENWLKYAHTTSARRKIKAWLNKNDDNILFDQNIIVKGAKSKKEILSESQGESLLPETEIVRSRNLTESHKSGGLRLGTDKNLMVSFAHCCSPVKGDPIIGYVSRGRGIIVHRKDCKNLPNMSEIKDRLIDVEWDIDTPVVVKRVRIQAKRRFDIFTEIEAAIKRCNGKLLEGRLEDDDGVSLVGTFTLESSDDHEMRKIIKSIRTMPNIDTVELL